MTQMIQLFALPEKDTLMRMSPPDDELLRSATIGSGSDTSGIVNVQTGTEWECGATPTLLAGCSEYAEEDVAAAREAFVEDPEGMSWSEFVAEYLEDLADAREARTGPATPVDIDRLQRNSGP